MTEKLDRSFFGTDVAVELTTCRQLHLKQCLTMVHKSWEYVSSPMFSITVTIAACPAVSASCSTSCTLTLRRFSA